MDDRNTNTRIQEIQKTENEMFKDDKYIRIKIQRPQSERGHRLPNRQQGQK